MMTYVPSLMTSEETTDAIQWIVYLNDRSILYLVCLIYTSKWFRVWLTTAMLEVRGCFDVLIPKGSKIGCEIYTETASQLPIIRSCVPNISRLISLKYIPLQLKSVVIRSWIFDQVPYQLSLTCTRKVREKPENLNSLLQLLQAEDDRVFQCPIY